MNRANSKLGITKPEYRMYVTPNGVRHYVKVIEMFERGWSSEHPYQWLEGVDVYRRPEEPKNRRSAKWVLYDDNWEEKLYASIEENRVKFQEWLDNRCQELVYPNHRFNVQKIKDRLKELSPPFSSYDTLITKNQNNE